jgi:transcriptional regulator with XRE-family HTH domain
MASNFPVTLKFVLDELKISQYQFADLTAMSQSMVTKLLNREGRATDETYQKIFDFFGRDTEYAAGDKRRAFLRRLAVAMMKDLIRDLHLPDFTPDLKSAEEVPFLNDSHVACPSGQAYVGKMFDDFNDDIILALWTLGTRAEKDKNFRNLIFSSAEIANSPSQNNGWTLTWVPEGYFQRRLSINIKAGGGLLKGQASAHSLAFSSRHDKPSKDG